MEFFNTAKAVRLRSHLQKFLVADEDEKTVRQSRNGSSHKSIWTVEFVQGKSHVIRLKSFCNKYLTASEEPFLLGMTCKKVEQDIQANKYDTCVEWEPISDNGFVKLRGRGGKFLRANWGTPPWRNSVTCDVPERTATQNWVLWEVEIVHVSLSLDSMPSSVSSVSSFSSLPPAVNGVGAGDTRLSQPGSTYVNYGGKNGMEFFQRAKAVRLQSHHGKYLVADEDEETVRQSRNGSSRKARWAVEHVEGKANVIRLKSCHGMYLTATNEPFLLGMTGKRVQQYLPPMESDATTEWEPLKEGAFHVKLRTREGKFLRANGGTPPWRNSITHDVPHRTATQDWVLWEVDVVDIFLSDLQSVPSALSMASSFSSTIDNDDFSGSPEIGSPLVHHSSIKSSYSIDTSPRRSEGRTIYYKVVDDDGNAGGDEKSFHFQGSSLEELTDKLEEEIGVGDVVVCSRNPLNGKLYPLRLALPPNSKTMHIVVVPSSSKVAGDFVAAT